VAISVISAMARSSALISSLGMNLSLLPTLGTACMGQNLYEMRIPVSKNAIHTMYMGGGEAI
ncbi:hypothetical protein, partial [Paenibacillus odorifer]|uniref:hypothetical protein n=1 Tax=Paenibacillus odorifer TaxID=189426 RepID=UPI00097A5897